MMPPAHPGELALLPDDGMLRSEVLRLVGRLRVHDAAGADIIRSRLGHYPTPEELRAARAELLDRLSVHL